MAKDKAETFEVKQTGLLWPGKRTEVERVMLPFQTVETIKESKADRDDLSIFRQKGEHVPGWRNQLIWGDNKYIMASLLSEYAGKINLIYIDPPFATGSDFSINIRLGDLEWTKEASVIEEKAYRDTWGQGLDSYLQMMHDRLVLMRELLVEKGTIYVHLDWHVGHYVKIIMDEIWGKDFFLNDIIWCYTSMQKSKRNWNRKHDVILAYTKSDQWVFNADQVLEEYEEGYRERFKYKDEIGWYMIRGKGGGQSPIHSQGDLTPEHEKKYPDWTYRQYLKEGGLPKDWWEIPFLNSNSAERVAYDTQKPEALLEPIIKASSNEGDLVADFFCGSGTTLAVAEKLGRRWIGADLSKFAIHTTRKRLLDIPDCKPFEVLNLGKYQKAKLKENGIAQYIDFILKLYHAEPLTGYSTLHGKKAGRTVHIGDVDSIITEREIQETVKECATAGIKTVDILGWDFEMGLHDLVDRIGDEYSVKIRLVQIPREALEIRDPTKEEVKFFDLNYLEIEYKQSGKDGTIALKEFVISNPEYLPDEVRKKVKKFTDYIDYWAIDFDYKDDTFHNMWQSFRTRKHPSLETKAKHSYEKTGKYQVLVKVVDIFGNDTNKLVEITVR